MIAESTLPGDFKLHSALALKLSVMVVCVQEEGLSCMWQRHTDMHHMLWEGLNSMGLQPYVSKPEERLVTVNTIKVRRFVLPVSSQLTA